jgi:hypothetical protein
MLSSSVLLNLGLSSGLQCSGGCAFCTSDLIFHYKNLPQRKVLNVLNIFFVVVKLLHKYHGIKSYMRKLWPQLAQTLSLIHLFLFNPLPCIVTGDPTGFKLYSYEQIGHCDTDSPTSEYIHRSRTHNPPNKP